MDNPYTERAMITDATMFFGREEEIDSIFSRLANSQSYSIVGQRRIGKSSLLYYLCQPEVYRSRVSDLAKCAFAYFDLQTVGEPTRERFLRLVLRKLAQASDGRLCTDYEPTYDGFRTFIETSHDAGWGLVLCLDEFEVVCGRGEFDSDFFAFLRGLANSYNLAYVTASRWVLHELCHMGKVDSSQFWNIFTTLHLGLLKEGEARDLITVPFARSEVEISAEDADFVLRLAGQHPLFLQVACYHLFEARQKGVVDYAEVEARFRQEADPYFGYIWDHLKDEERLTLYKLSHGEQDVDRLAGLERSGSVVKQDEAHHFFSEAFGRFVGEQPVSQELKRVSGEYRSLKRGIRIERCFLTGGACAFRDEITIDEDKVFIGMPFRDHYQDIFDLVIQPTLAELGLSPWKADDIKGNIAINCKICRALQESPQAIINISEANPNVFFEMGLAYGLGKSVLLLKDEESTVPSDLQAIEYTQYSRNRLRDLRDEIRRSFRRDQGE
jgi:hypothetical protein